MLFSGRVNHLRNSTLARTFASSPAVTTMPAPCWTANDSPSANFGQGSTFSVMSWLSVSLVMTREGKNVPLEDEPT